MELAMRRYRGEEDYWRIRDFLRHVFRLNGWRELSLQAYRFDYWPWHGIENLGHGRLDEHVLLWETTQGRDGRGAAPDQANGGDDGVRRLVQSASARALRLGGIHRM